MPKCIYLDSSGKSCPNDAMENEIYCSRHRGQLFATPEGGGKWPEVYQLTIPMSKLEKYFGCGKDAKGTKKE